MKTRIPTATNFYPGDNAIQLEEFLADFSPPDKLPGQLKAAVVPHAGWTYSGGTAARTLYSLAQKSQPRTAIMLGADHAGVDRSVIYPAGRWLTPFGDLPVDEHLAEQIMQKSADLIYPSETAHQGEHSLEVQCPMIKYLWPELKIVPVLVPATTASLDLGHMLGDNFANDDVILIASTDLTHYGYPYGFSPAGVGKQGLEWMAQNDRQMIDLILDCEAGGIIPDIHRQRNACGGGALTAITAAVKRMGISRGHLVEYTTSHGDRPADEFEYGVGYAGIVF